MKPYIRGKYAKASCAPINALKKSGITAEVGYESDYRKRNNTLLAYVRAENVFKVPREWGGFKVEVHPNNELVDHCVTSAGSGDNDRS